MRTIQLLFISLFLVVHGFAQVIKVMEPVRFLALGDSYTIGQGVTADKEIIAYCRIGERSSHTWFVLTYLLGYPKVKNYDGSWTEWGNLVNAPIEK